MAAAVPVMGTVAAAGPPGVRAAVSTYDAGVPPAPGVHDRFTVRPLTTAGLSVGVPGAAGPATVRVTSFDEMLYPDAFCVYRRAYHVPAGTPGMTALVVPAGNGSCAGAGCENGVGPAAMR